MIKGCAKRVVVVRDIDSNFFEEAFFIVKQGTSCAKSGEGDFINEANRIVRYDLPVMNTVVTAKKPNLSKNGRKKSTPAVRGMLRDVLMFVFGFGISAVLCTFIYYSGIAP